MKSNFLSLLVILTIIFLGTYSYAEPRSTIVNGVDITKWPANINSTAVLNIYLEIMKSDYIDNLILNELNYKLKSHGLNGIQSIFNFCNGEPTAKGATAFFSQNVRIVETRVWIPGLPQTSWQVSSQSTIEKSFSSKVIRTPFLEFLMVSELPQICIHKANELYFGYDSFVHELTHFLLKDPFSNFDKLLATQPFPDYADFSINNKGGEFDAFKAGAGAGIRLLEKYQIQSSGSESYKFFNTHGELVDEAGLKSYLFTTYSAYYQESAQLKEIEEFKQNLTNMKLKFLKDSIYLYVKALNQPELIKSLDDEIALLEKLKSL